MGSEENHVQQMSRTRLIQFLLATALGSAPIMVLAQDGEDPCGVPTDKKIVKLLEEASKAKDPMERHSALKSTLEVDPECVECNFRLGLSAYRIAKEGGKGFKAAVGYFANVRHTHPAPALVPYEVSPAPATPFRKFA